VAVWAVEEHSMVDWAEMVTLCNILRNPGTPYVSKWAQLPRKEQQASLFYADVFCYKDGTEIADPDLSVHLANFGINTGTQSKTEKSLAELQLEQNLRFNFNMATEDGIVFEPIFGPGLTGLKNIGSSCYLASVMQTLFSIPQFQEKYVNGADIHLNNCRDAPSDCLTCQLCKLADGMLSGKYSKPVNVNDSNSGQTGIAPLMFKEVIGKGHEEFSTMRQQDAGEFLSHVISCIEKKESSSTDPTKCCKFILQERIQCLECEKVKYKEIPTSSLVLQLPAKVVGTENGKKTYESVDFFASLAAYFEAQFIDFQCPSDGRSCSASQTLSFKTYPDYLFSFVSRFVLGDNWVIEKLDANLIVSESLELGSFRGTPKSEGETLLPETADSGPDFNESDLNTLLGMGFPEIRCKRALLKTQHQGAELAMNWLFEHMDDPDIDMPLQSSPNFSESDISQLIEMGFTRSHVTRALTETDGNMDRAVDWLFSHPDQGEDVSMGRGANEVPFDQNPARYDLFAIIAHRGTSAHCGHYVAYIKKNGQWVLFNDNKVVAVPASASFTGDGYIYIYRRNKYN
jgi:ubiquitin carboxyl-terminal hydrolase 5/13